MTQRQKLKFMTLNVNGLANPVKRARVMAKLKKDYLYIIFLQETHLTTQEHEKLIKFGYKNVLSSSRVDSHKRGVAKLLNMSNLTTTLKAVICGKIIAKAAYMKKTRTEQYQKLTNDLSEQEHKFKLQKDQEIQKEM